MAYDPNLPAGSAPAAASSPVVVAPDGVVGVDPISDWRLADIRQALSAIAAAKGILSDLRVSVVNAPNVTTVTTVSTVTNQAQMGALATNAAVPNWANQTAVQSFVNNISRS